MTTPDQTECTAAITRGIDWFSRGRDAFAEGRPCRIDDLRLTRRNIQEWYAGWNHQAAMNGRKNLMQADVDDVVRQLESDRAALLRERAADLARMNTQP